MAGDAMVVCIVRVGHRVLMSPGALAPATGAPGSGSRFKALAACDGDKVQTVQDNAAVHAANVVLSGDEHAEDDDPSSTVQPRKMKIKEELVQEFREDVVLPSVASGF